MLAKIAMTTFVICLIFSIRSDLAFAAQPVVMSTGFVKIQGYLPFADEPINYRGQVPDDPIARLNRRLQEGNAQLAYDRKQGYLPAVLQALRVPVSSQTLVFSKTSFQFPNINPQNPRALYFNDDVYVGRVHDGKFLEFVAFDPNQGAMFYVLDENTSPTPRFERAAVDCVQCHVAPSTRGVPGVLMRSVFTRPNGYPAAGKPSYVIGHSSPLQERWGGWYVTARQGPADHLGNQLTAASAPARQLHTSLATVDTTRYLADSSDIVALLVLAHQTQMHNLITELNYRTRLAPQTAEAHRHIEDLAEQVVRYLLFVDEAPLSTPIEGTSTFASEFAARGPRDPQGRSLRDFDLHTRIFQHRCSYLIYSEDFDELPSPAKEHIYRRLFEILTGQDESSVYASITAAERQNILEILVATKPNLPEQWKALVRQAKHQQKGSS